MAEIWGMILAAGESRRMGFPKMLLDFNGVSMIELVINNVKKSKIDEVMIVLGGYRDELMETVQASSINYCYNNDYKDGMLSSVKCGLRNIPSDCKAILVFQGDQPFITPDLINTVIDAFYSSGKGIVIPVCENKRGHPLMVDSKYREHIENIKPDIGLRNLASQYSEDVFEVETMDIGILKDFDTFEEYEREINQN